MAEVRTNFFPENILELSMISGQDGSNEGNSMHVDTGSDGGDEFGVEIGIAA